MAANASFQLSQEASSATSTATLNNRSVQKTMTYLKSLAESPDLTSIPSSHDFTIKIPNFKEEEVLEEKEVLKIPTVDFSLLTSGNPDQRSMVVSELAKACEYFGFFMVINHGVPKELMDAVIDGCSKFFDLSDEEKMEIGGKHILDPINPIRCGTGGGISVEKVSCWRDFLKTTVHPQFHFPDKPSGFSEIALEYCKRAREVYLGIVEGISESLGLEADDIAKKLNLDSGSQSFLANLYPPCPQPELTLGLPPHSDLGFLNFLIQNGVDGLQIQHNGKWFNVNVIPNSFLVNVGDQLEILSNGKYKSVIHKAVVHHNKTRISLVITNGPSLDTVVTPAPELIQDQPPAYIGTRFKDFLELQKSHERYGKSLLNLIRL